MAGHGAARVTKFGGATLTASPGQRIHRHMTSPDPYTPPSYRGAIAMLILIILGIAFAWWAFVNVLDTDFGRSVDIPNVPAAPETAP